MAYADYTYYLTTYAGAAITEDDFPRLAARASSYLDYITHGAATKNTGLDAIKMAACAVAEAWKRNEDGGEVVSESVGGWSRSYSTSGMTGERALFEAARIHLEPAGLTTTVIWA